MNSKIILEQVEFIPKVLEQGILYVSNRYNVAVHLCACGCGNKVTTPLSPAEWSFHKEDGKPTLHPSIGNWQIPCKSHYWIEDGEIIWSHAWSDEQIEKGRKDDQKKLEEYFRQKEPIIQKALWRKILDWFSNLFKSKS